MTRPRWLARLWVWLWLVGRPDWFGDPIRPRTAWTVAKGLTARRRIRRG